MSLRALGAHVGDQRGIEELLANKVEQMIDEAVQEQRLGPADELSQPLGPAAGDERTRKLPLVRLRVDYSGFSTIHSQRFGTRFVNRIANPKDLLLWAKTPATRCASPSLACRTLLKSRSKVLTDGCLSCRCASAAWLLHGSPGHSGCVPCTALGSPRGVCQCGFPGRV